MAGPIDGGGWLRTLRTDPDPRHYLVCFPPGGGSAGAYRALVRAIGPGAEVLAVQYPGRQDRLGEPQVPDLHRMADAIAAELLTRRRTPLALFGHSMGATLAYETAQRLTRGGQPVAALFVSGRPTPDYAEPGRLHLGPDDALITELERLATDPSSVAILRADPSLADLVLPAVRADYQAVETYTHRSDDPLPCDIAALVSTEDPTTTPEQADRWGEFTRGAFERATFPGGHFYLDDHVEKVAAFVTARWNGVGKLSGS
ncbi:thioesterase [Nocardia puris]|uniref:thioesterase II family protein n=1 Tax=Nocardia puris TaxID=208602 RepID=UPI0018931051|nr:alpha/beta fold hydrolase [Nocardia puris]MBF6210426.1 thioesterase [Nocardia puris]MBF6367501.1 thioesterase [Nocardia puris]MBF6457686.1 thioesterase [Nocardia puris]